MTEGQFLTRQEIDTFLDEIDRNNNGSIEYDEVEKKLDEVHNEIAPTAKPHNLYHAEREDEQRHKFLRAVMGTDKNRISRKEFAEIVKTWKVPSMSPDWKADEDGNTYMKQMPLGSRIRAVWNVQGPEILFVTFVIGLQIGMGTWQLVKYLVGPYTHVNFCSVCHFQLADNV